MFPGHCTLCIPTQDLRGMQRFYEACGMVTVRSNDNALLLSNGDLHLFLMGFPGGVHSLNFRGADPFAIYDQVVAAGVTPDGNPATYKKEQYNTDVGGTNWMTHDPDGHAVFFDTNQHETGERGKLQILCRLLDATQKQLINLGASTALQSDFNQNLMTRFVTDDVRTAVDLPKPPLTGEGQFAGHFTWCLSTKDNNVSRAYYEALGLEVGLPSEGDHIHMGNSCCDIDLMTFLDENWLNFRGADVFRLYQQMHEQMKAADLELEGEPSRYNTDEFSEPGAHWKTKDPDGNVVYFDTTDPELIESGDIALIAGVLERACRQLQDNSADVAAIEAIQNIVTHLE